MRGIPDAGCIAGSGKARTKLARRETRLARLREAKEALQAEAREREERRRAEMEAEGRKPRTPPDGRDPFAPKPTEQCYFTDPESKIMKASDGAFHRSCNAQAVVDAEAQVVVAAETSSQAPDTPQLDPALDQPAENLETLDEIVAAGFDAELVRGVLQLFDDAEQQRRQAPPGVKITRSALGADRRMPITNAWRPFRREQRVLAPGVSPGPVPEGGAPVG